MLLMDRVTILMTADLAALVQRAVQTQSLAAIDQYLRQTEDYLASLEDAAGVAAQISQILERRLSEHQQKAISFDRSVDAFLVDGNVSAAAASQSRLNSARQLIANYAEQHDQHQRDAGDIARAMEALEARHTAMKAYRAEAAALLEAAHRQPEAMPPGVGPDALADGVDGDLGGRARRLAAALNTARGTTGEPNQAAQIERVLDQQRVEAQLAERRQRLAVRHGQAAR